MTDQSPQQAPQQKTASDKISFGSVVWCWFPEFSPDSPTARQIPKPGPKLRRCLVVGVEIVDDKPFLQVVMGTSKGLHTERPTDLIVDDVESQKKMGLATATRFNFSGFCGRAKLPYTKQFFAAHERTGSVVAGRAPKEDFKRIRQRLEAARTSDRRRTMKAEAACR